MDYVLVVNLILSLIIFFFGIKKYKDTGAKAFIYISLGFLMFGISHATGLLGYAAPMKATLIAVRTLGYILVIVGMLV
jgi:hypothetical protein